MNSANPGILERENTCLIVIDVQERFRSVIHGFGEMAENAKKLIRAFRIFDIPVIVTEQNPEKLGRTIRELSNELGDFEPVEKLHFSCFGEADFAEELAKLGRKQIVLCGIEAHICVLKTALEGLKKGYEIHVASDAVSSRRQTDKDFALRRMSQSGVFLTTSESLIFQLMERAGTEEFRKVKDIVK